MVSAVADGRLVGFARAPSDTAFRATIFDVILAEEWRGSGLGKRLMEEMLARPSIASSNRVELLCLPEMASFYGRFGFVEAQAG